jgi:hypothetical protein
MNPLPPTLLTYDVNPKLVPVSTGTPNMAAVTVTIQASTTALCSKIVLNIPIGDVPGALFSKTPTPTSSQTGWTNADSQPILAAQAVKPLSYHTVTLTNPDPTGAVPTTFTVTISGSVSIGVDGADIILSELSALVSPTPTFSVKKTPLHMDMEKDLPLFVRSFVAKSVANPTVPDSEFANGAAISLSWESNGTNFLLYRKAELDALDLGSSTSCNLPEGITSDTTFVLVATLNSPQSVSTLYEALTLTVSNPTYGPKQSTPPALEDSADTAHCVRLSDGTPKGNIVLQALTGDNSGYASLNFNGYTGGAEKRFNDQKNRWRIVTDQRGATDLFTIDTFDGTTVTAPLAIATNGNVGIGTSTPAQKLDVTGNTNVTGNSYVSGNVGIGTSTPAARLDVAGGGGDTIDLNVNGRVRTGDSAGQGGVWLNGTETQFVGQINTTTLGFWNGGDWRVAVDNSGNVGIGTSAPAQKLEVDGAVYTNGEYSGFIADAFGDSRVGLIKYPYHFAGIWRTTDSPLEIGRVNVTSLPGAPTSFTTDIFVSGNGFVGIGTSSPYVPLTVNGATGYYINANYYYITQGGTGPANPVTVNVSILASNDIVCDTLRAFSDARLKTIIGLSDHAADLALLRRLRITDYTMRDRVQFGEQAFKKIIAQELEEVFPQAVRQHTGFLPDIYASASQVQRQGEALLITLPAGLPQAATAGQRLKLIGPVGEVIATIAEATEAGSQQLLVLGADSLADTPQEVFVFGLEHADVRTVDYEAIAMLNVSATQALARQVEELHQQNAALNEQNQAQRARLTDIEASLQLLQEQMAGLLVSPA